MARYIDAEDFIDLFYVASAGQDKRFIQTVKQVIEDTPTADVAEVKHGYWVDKPTGRYCHIGSYCSVCEEKSGIGGIEGNRHKPYCPNCGAKMDGTPKERGGEK